MKDNSGKELKENDWIFTCKMNPVQFKEFTDANNEDFISLKGSYHSKYNCGLSVISDNYAKWFIDNKISSLYEEQCNKDFNLYENLVKELCLKNNIEFEGI